MSDKNGLRILVLAVLMAAVVIGNTTPAQNATAQEKQVEAGDMDRGDKIMLYPEGESIGFTGTILRDTSQDPEGNYLDGGKTYKVTLPAPIPAKDFWAFTVYSGQHRSMLETDQKLAGLDSTNPPVKLNADGSFTIWFGPSPPEGHEGNWVKTMPGKSWNTILRLYGPLEPWFDKTWKPSDIELVQ